jgi:hypothetical protein
VDRPASANARIQKHQSHPTKALKRKVCQGLIGCGVGHVNKTAKCCPALIPDRLGRSLSFRPFNVGQQNRRTLCGKGLA